MLPKMAVAEVVYQIPQVSPTTLKNTKSLLKILILGSIAGELETGAVGCGGLVAGPTP